MELIVLGKYGPFPSKEGACSGYLVRQGNINLLMDCGSGVLSRLQDYIGINDISAIFLSHMHGDHMADMLVLRYALAQYQARGEARLPLRVFAPQHPAEELKAIADSTVFEIIGLPVLQSFMVGELELTFCPMTHPVPCSAVRVAQGEKTLVYTGDTNSNSELAGFAKGADVLLCDAAFLQKEANRPLPHLTAKEAGCIAGEAGVGRLICTHMSPLTKEEDILAEACAQFANTVVAQEGELYKI